jgi:hypothetical protein
MLYKPPCHVMLYFAEMKLKTKYFAEMKLKTK